MKKCLFSKRNEGRIIGEPQDIDRYHPLSVSALAITLLRTLSICVFVVFDHLTLNVQELTKLRITDIQGIEKPEPKIVHKPSKAADTEQPEAELVG